MGFTVTWGIAAINSIVVTGVIYLLLSLIFKGNDNIYIGGDFIEDELGNIFPEKKSAASKLLLFGAKNAKKEEIIWALSSKTSSLSLAM